MKFELTFDKEIYNKQMDLLFDLGWRRKTAYYKNAQYLGAILIFIGIAMICTRPNLFGFGLILFGLSNLIPFIYYFFKIKSKYKKFDVAKTIESEIYEDSTHVFEFTEKSLITNDDENLRNFDWDAFKIHLIVEGNLVLITKNNEPLIIGETEVGKENFQKIISFVEKKIKII